MRLTVAGGCLLPEKSCERPIFVIGQDGSNENKEKWEDLLTHQDSKVPVLSSSVQWSGARDFENIKMLHEKKAKKKVSKWDQCWLTLELSV